MAVLKSEFSSYIKTFQFRELFNEMGWNNDRTRQMIPVGDIIYDLKGMAEKSGFRIFICEPSAGNKLPDLATRKKIEGKVTKLFQEHIIIFIDENKREQVWQLAVRKAGNPTKISETIYTISQDPELLYQRASGLFFTLDEEEKVTIIDVTKRVAENFQQNNEKVTKKFYERFKKEHTSFLKFIKGIDDGMSMDWYASLMLNRLMFCYFIQKKGFLDSNKNYLQDKLKACRVKKGKNKFYSFYRNFLLALFHQGLGAPEHTKNLEVEIGKIPYLNGGLFDEHEIEKTFKKIEIEDKAFEKLFDFFDEYEWHLDTREAASGRDINPDVIGYIFEKYINDRAQMGAYYTKEDITDYISKNCIIPWLFDEVKRNYPKAFTDNGWLWNMVKNSGDDYIYDAVKYGIPESSGLFDDLPEEIRKGFEPELEKKIVDGKGPWLWELRKEWNRPAPSDIALPTEIYREVIERRKRYAEIKNKISSGEVKEINDFITFNLNIRQFAQDVIETNEDAEFILHFYKALTGITILDPTCGSGAFLFAALNILELLYEACILRMKNFIYESGKGKHKYFEEILEKVNAPEHPNLSYFIYKSIILNNLYGVDIMKEATEIAKLRLFLKLVATVDADYRKPNMGLEPLPDVDFNIRSGNTLVGFATEEEINDAFTKKLDFDSDSSKIKEECDIVARAFSRYKEIQISYGEDYKQFVKAKEDLNKRLKGLNDELNIILHKEVSAIKYDKWLKTHQPFHWFAEFYEIIHDKGGFDVIIGNPPYVEYTTEMCNYTIVGYKTVSCGNLYAYLIERCSIIKNKNSSIGLIVPMSITSIREYKILREFIEKQFDNIWCTNHAIRPVSLFSGVSQRVSILLLRPDKNKVKYYTRYLRTTSVLSYLFSGIIYYAINIIPGIDSIQPKISKVIEKDIWNKLGSLKCNIDLFSKYGKREIHFKDYGETYWIFPLGFTPFLTPVKSFKKLFISNDGIANFAIICFNSSLFYMFYSQISDCWHFGKWHMVNFPLGWDKITISNELIKKIYNRLMKSYIENRKTRFDSRINADLYEYSINASKSIIDQIDCLLAQHYGFSQEELDFIINYDIKYRMGKELDSEEEEEE